MSYECSTCVVSYQTQSGLWKHNMKNHNGVTITITQKTTRVYNCGYCKQRLASRQSKWRHEQICEKKKELENKIVQMDCQITLSIKNQQRETLFNNEIEKIKIMGECFIKIYDKKMDDILCNSYIDLIMSVVDSCKILLEIYGEDDKMETNIMALEMLKQYKMDHPKFIKYINSLQITGKKV
jgi:uncharacterized protein YmfQ (DUF2313 family)